MISYTYFPYESKQNVASSFLTYVLSFLSKIYPLFPIY